MRKIAWLLVAVAVVAVASGCATTKMSGCKAPKAPAFALRVNCGADDPYTDAAGCTWLPDQMMFGDLTWGAADGDVALRSEVTISGTTCPAIYLSERYGMTAYTFQVAEGTYTVKLHFAETFEEIYGAGERVFSVSINGTEVATALDPYKEAGGLFKPLVKSFSGISPKDGKIMIGFKETIQNPEINGIEILSE